MPAAQIPDICDARRLFPAAADQVYFNTAAIGNQAALTIFDDFGPDTIYAATTSSLPSSGRRSPTSDGSLLTCPNRTGARS
jgi:hypothetical protein